MFVLFFFCFFFLDKKVILESLDKKKKLKQKTRGLGYVQHKLHLVLGT